MKPSSLILVILMILHTNNALSELGIDHLLAHPEQYLSHKRFGIVCNRASVNTHKDFLPDMLYQWATTTKQAQLTALFSPEHGLLMNQEAAAYIASDATSPWGCPIYSLHGATKKPTAAMLKNVDTLIFDLPDVGVRCFTYLSTLRLVLEAAAEHAIAVIIVDRPNPIAFWGQTGPTLEPDYVSFVGAVQVPFVHGMTIGEVAQLCNQTIGANLTIIGSCKNMTVDAKHFIPPSPNLMSIEHVYAYPITVFLEGTNYSEGRGTLLPFLQIGAPWVNADMLATSLNAYHWEGIAFEPTSFIPTSLPGIAQHPKHEQEICFGVQLHITDPNKINPMAIAFELLKTLFTFYPGQSEWILWDERYGIDLLVGNTRWRTTIMEMNKGPQ